MISSLGFGDEADRVERLARDPDAFGEVVGGYSLYILSRFTSGSGSIAPSSRRPSKYSEDLYALNRYSGQLDEKRNVINRHNTPL